jgi:hypothetical protein
VASVPRPRAATPGWLAWVARGRPARVPTHGVGCWALPDRPAVALRRSVSRVAATAAAPWPAALVVAALVVAALVVAALVVASWAGQRPLPEPLRRHAQSTRDRAGCRLAARPALGRAAVPGSVGPRVGCRRPARIRRLAGSWTRCRAVPDRRSVGPASLERSDPTAAPGTARTARRPHDSPRRRRPTPAPAPLAGRSWFQARASGHPSASRARPGGHLSAFPARPGGRWATRVPPGALSSVAAAQPAASVARRAGRRDAARRAAPAAGAARARPSASQPTADQPAADQPAADHPVADHPVADHPVADHPVADHPVAMSTSSRSAVPSPAAGHWAGPPRIGPRETGPRETDPTESTLTETGQTVTEPAALGPMAPEPAGAAPTAAGRARPVTSRRAVALAKTANRGAAGAWRPRECRATGNQDRSADAGRSVEPARRARPDRRAVAEPSRGEASGCPGAAGGLAGPVRAKAGMGGHRGVAAPAAWPGPSGALDQRAGRGVAAGPRRGHRGGQRRCGCFRWPVAPARRTPGVPGGRHSAGRSAANSAARPRLGGGALSAARSAIQHRRRAGCAARSAPPAREAQPAPRTRGRREPDPIPVAPAGLAPAGLAPARARKGRR